MLDVDQGRCAARGDATALTPATSSAGQGGQTVRSQWEAAARNYDADGNRRWFAFDPAVPQFLSYGGGTQSAALALMSCAGELPRLSAVIFADTQGELPETYEYAEYVRGHLEQAGIPFVVVTAGSLEEALLSPTPTSANATPPAHVVNPDGTLGRINDYRCSYDFKRRLVTRAVKQLVGGRGAWKRATVEQWMGFSADEVHRCKQPVECRCGHPLAKHASGTCEKCSCERFDRWQRNVFPLVAMRFTRQRTIRWFAENGHPEPPRSACWFCPNSSNARWRYLEAEHPDLFARACLIDETIREGGSFNRRGREEFHGRLYLHPSMVPLRDADLRDKEQVLADDYGMAQLFDCTADSCGT
ncbi:MAG TPA: hypothetical protein VKV25_00835 [Acidimicrobiales bacterium]|nr:hypothetical protein [Acidimicrobiales bacterium]